MADIQCRKWNITINNPEKYACDYEYINSSLQKIKGLVYYCMSREIGQEGTSHIHIYVCFKNPKRFTSMKNIFPAGHLETVKGTSKDNRDYIFKEGKHKGTDKEETNIKESHFEYGELPIESQGQRSDLADLYDNIKSGLNDIELIEQNANNLLRLEKIQRVRNSIRFEKFKNVFREVKVFYIYGETGVGKTRYVFEKFGFNNLYRVTDYEHPFDTYNGQDCIIFDEFIGQLSLVNMLMFLDGYPLELPSRYFNKQACYTNVYMLSNLSFENLVSKYSRNNSSEQIQAFRRRVNNIYEMTPFGLSEV